MVPGIRPVARLPNQPHPASTGGHCARTSLSGTRILMRSPPGLAGKRMSRPSAVGQGHG
jgi:hypothetical protein